MTEFERGVQAMFDELTSKARPHGEWLTGALIGDDVGRAHMGHAVAARDAVLSNEFNNKEDQTDGDDS